jgi:D-glycero-alpha-D-manno-heptose-7-phosphate kinase
MHECKEFGEFSQESRNFMIISSSPLRFSLNGGGSDLPSFLEVAEGLTVSMPLNKYVYVTLHESFSENYRIAYSQIEDPKTIQEIRHPIVRACLELLEWEGPALEITSVADVPSNGTGLGSSSAFTVALIAGILHLQGRKLNYFDIAKLACDVEIEILKSPIGYQDQYSTAMGEINVLRFYKGGKVEIEPVFGNQKEKNIFVSKLNESLLFFHIDQPRSANEILNKQQFNIRNGSAATLTTKKMVQLAGETVSCMKIMNIPQLGKLLTDGWALKTSINGDDSDANLTRLIEWCSTAPIYGAKLLGAGGGGFLAVLAEKSKHGSIINSLDKKYRHYDAKVEILGPRVQRFGG